MARLLLYSILIGVTVEILMITFVYPEEGARHSLEVYLTEVEWMEKDFNESSIGGVSPYSLLSLLTDRISDSILAAISYFEIDSNFGIQNGNYLSLIGDYVWAIGFVLCTIALRFAILTLSMPVYVLTAIWGLTYGLTRREIRKCNNGRESFRKFNLSKSMIIPTLQYPWIIYLSIPYAVHPLVIIVPSCLVLVLSIRFASEYFEKTF